MKLKLFTLILIAAVCFSQGVFAGLFDKVIDAGTKAVEKKEAAPVESSSVAPSNAAPTNDEQTLGQGLAAMVLGAFPPSGSEALNQYVSKVGLTVASASARPGLAYRFQVVDARDASGKMIVNAFSAPGGYIFVTRGLLAQLHSEAELAGVLAHEVAHVALKHSMKAIGQQKTTGAITSLGGQLVAQHTSGVGGTVASTFANEVGTPFVNNLFEKGFSRADEYQADAAAVKYTGQVGYDPKGLIHFLEILEKQEGGRNYSTILRTHPQPADRIGRLEKIVGGASEKQILADRFKANVGGN